MVLHYLLGLFFLQLGVYSQVSLTSSEYDQSARVTTFTYDIAPSTNVQSWVLGLEDCPEIAIVSSVPSTPLSLSFDAQTQIHGIQWWGQVSQYKLIVSGHVKTGSTSFVIVQGAYKSTTGVVDGPVCSYYEDVVCNAGGPYYAHCINNQLSVHLLGHNSLHAVSYFWDHFIPGAVLLTPSSVSSVLTIPVGTCLASYRISLTVTGHDYSDSQTCIAHVMINDDTAPQIHNIYERDISAEPHDIPVPMLLTAEDDCDPNVQIKFREDRVESAHPCSYQLHRTWIAEDACGNIAMHTQIISVVDTQPPTLSGVEADASYPCNEVPPPCSVEGNDYNDVTVEIKEFKNPGPCDCQYSLTRKWIATDCAGNTAAATQQINVVDDVPPQIFGVGDDVTVDCDAVPAVPSPSATDNCCGATISYFDSKSGGTCVHEYTITRSWTAIDECGNSHTESQNIVVKDDKAPTMSGVGDDITVECDEVPLPCEVEVADDCDNYVHHNFDESTEFGTCEDEYTLVFTWSASDICGNTVSEVQRVSVVDSTPPTLSGLPPPELTVDCDSVPSFFVKAHDNCDYNIELESKNMTEITYAAAVGNPTDYLLYMTWKATDNCGNAEMYHSTITVQDNDLPVLIGVPDDLHAPCEGVPGAAEVEATDNCCEQYALTPTFIEKRIDGTCDDNYVLVRTWTVEDCSHNVHSEQQEITVEDNQAPVFHGLPGYDVVKCDQIPPVAVVSITDNCDDEANLVYENKTISGSCKTQNKFLRIWTANDNCGNVVSYTQTIISYDDEPPVLSGTPHDTTLDCDIDSIAHPDALSHPQASDNCDPYITVIDTFEKKTGTCEYDYVYYRHWSAQDDCGNSATSDQTIQIQDIDPPTWVSVPEALINHEYPTEPAVEEPTAIDECGYGPEITFNERTLQFGYLCPKAYRLVRAWFLIDLCGNMGTPAYQHVVIDDTTPPTFMSHPEDKTVECDDIPPPFPVNAIDHYEDIVVTMTEESDFGTCNQDYDIRREWSALDSCGNLNKTEQVITVTDTTPPVMKNIPDDTTAECNAPPPATIIAEDNCDGYIDVSLIEDNTEVTYNEYTEAMKVIYRHWRVSDNCGNTEDAFQTIEVYDTKYPYFLGYDSDIVVECDDIPAVPNVIARDECDSNPTAYYDPKSDEGDCEDEWTIFREWTVDDHVGHSTVYTQTVSVVDTTPPVLSGYLIDTISVECDDLPIQTMMTATDNCDDSVHVEMSSTKIDPFYACLDQYLLFWTWSATDNCGNSVSYTKTISVDDSIPPVLICDDGACTEYSDIEVECEDIYLSTIIEVEATDNCDATPSVTQEHVTVHGTCDDAYLKISEFVAKDNCGNTATYITTVTVVDTTPPVWTSDVNTTRRVPYDVNPDCPKNLEATDVCDDDVIISCSSIVVNGICPQDYTMTCTCTAVDDCGNSVEFVQVIQVYDDEPPVISDVPSTTVECLSYVTVPTEPHVDWGYGTGSITVTQHTIPQSCGYKIIYTWTAVDDCKLEAVLHQTVEVYDDTPPDIYNVPEDETVDCHPGAPVGYLTGEDNCDGKVLVIYDSEKISDDGPYCYTIVRSWSAVDHCGHVTVETQTVVVDDNEAPTVSYPPSQTTTDCHSMPFASADDIHVSDNCDAHRNVTFTDEREPGSCECEWQQYRSWHVCDSCGNCVDVHATVTVQDDIPPSLSLYPSDLTVQTGDVPYAPDVVGYDTYGSEVVVEYTETRVNSSYAAGSEWLYKLYRHWVTYDDCRNKEEKTSTITVIDTIPVPIVGVPKDITLPCIEIISIPPIYQSSHIQSTIEANIAASEAQPDDIQITLITDVTNDGTCDSEYVWIRCWQTQDHSNNIEEACFTITVVDEEPPHFTTFPEVEFAECEIPQGQVITQPECEDNCWIAPTVVLDVEDMTGGAYSGFVARTWTCTDACGGTAMHTQTIWIADTEPPTWVNPPDDITVCCDEVPPTPNLTATDGCHDDVTIDLVEWKDVICEGEYFIFYTWRAIDGEGNWIMHEQQVQVNDCLPPVLYAGSFGAYNPSTAVAIASSELHSHNIYECPWVEVYHSVYAKDECSEYPWDVPVYNIDRWGDDCLAYIAFHWETADDCGNEVTWDQTIQVHDTIPPVLIGCPIANETLHCGTPLGTPYVSASDECDPFPEVSRSEELIMGSCDYEYEVVVTWTVVDRCGYDVSCDHTVTYHDLNAPVLTLHAPGNVTSTCDVPYAVPAVSATDDCQDYFNIDYDQVQVPGSCPCEYSLHRTWTTSDKCGKEALVTQTITVNDGIPPTLSDQPKDITVPCFHIPPKPPMTGSDNCCDVTLTYDEIVEDGTCAQHYHTIRTWVVTDECGLSDTYEYTITVVDTEPPEFTLGDIVPKFLKVECDEVKGMVELTAYDICSKDVEVTPTEFTHSNDCDDAYYLLRNWDAQDECGNSVHLEQTVQVYDGTPPTLELPDEESYECDYVPTQDNHDVTASDNCDPDPHVSFTKAILGADCSDNWSVMMMWVTTDRCGNEAIFSLVVPIDDTLYPELEGVPSDITVDCHLPDVPHVTVVDDCDKLLTAKFEQEMPYIECPYEYTAIRRWSATDRCQNTVEGSQRITVRDDGPPTLVGVPPDDAIGCKDHAVVAHVTGNDVCETTVDVVVNQVIVPGSCSFQYATIITWSAEDKCGNTVSGSQTVTVHDTIPPTLSAAPENINAPCHAIPNAAILHGQDDCSYSLDVQFGQTTIDGTCDNDYIMKRTWTVVDDCGNVNSTEQLITVYDTEEPNFIGIIPHDITVDCHDVAIMPSYDVEDNCGGYVHYEEGETTDIGSCNHEYTLNRWYKATDICGNVRTANYTVSVNDHEDPVLLNVPADTTFECDEYLPQPEIQASDSCGYDATVDPDSNEVPGTCESEYLIIRTWQATDDCGNVDDHTQSVHKVDTTPPVIEQHEDVTCEVGNVPPPWQCTWTDNCGEEGSQPFLSQRIDGSCVHQYKIKYECEAYDCAGNVATASHVIHVFDFTPPVILGVGPDITVEYQKFPQLEFAHLSVSVTDNSDLEEVASYGESQLLPVVDVKIPGYDENDYVVIRTFSAKDQCGNEVSRHQTITVIDRTPPCFDEEPADVTVECDAIPDPCDVYTVGEDLNVDFYEGQTTTDSYDVRIKRTWSASDHSGNSYSWTQYIAVEDTTPPVFTRHPEDTTYECDCEGFPAIANLAAVDNCDDFVVVTHDEEEIDATCKDSYKLVRTWKATDHAGEVTSTDQTITIVDSSPPEFSSDPQSTTHQCDEVTFNGLQHFTIFDNCDDDVHISHAPVQSSTTSAWDYRGCVTTFSYTTTAVDECGNKATRSWNRVVEDTTPPKIVGGKHCVYNRVTDGYGSDKFFKTYTLDSLVSFEDACDDNSFIDSVWFNRTNDDTTNLLDGIVPQFVSPRSQTMYPNAADQLTPCNKNDAYTITVPTEVGVQYTLSGSVAQDPCHHFAYPSSTNPIPPSGKVTIYGLDDSKLGLRDFSPPRHFHVSPANELNGPWVEFQMHFTADSDQIVISVEQDGVVFNVPYLFGDDYYSIFFSEANVHYSLGTPPSFMSLVTYRSEGQWLSDYTTGSHLSCSQTKEITDLTTPCSEVTWEGTTYSALPVLKNSRFCYQSSSIVSRSIVSYMFGADVTVWIVTDYAEENPRAYGWTTLAAEIKKLSGPYSSVLDSLQGRGIIIRWWNEESSNSPVNWFVECPDSAFVSLAQCQGACYFNEYPFAFLYDDVATNYNNAGKCICGRDCLDVHNGQNAVTISQWHEGFYYDANLGTVNILAATDVDDLHIYMWVSVSDSCGNSAIGKVEFWVAPSLEAAASQGRTCDEPDSNLGPYVSGSSFTSDNHVQTDAALNPPSPDDVEAGIAENDINTVGELAHNVGHTSGEDDGVEDDDFWPEIPMDEADQTPGLF